MTPFERLMEFLVKTGPTFNLWWLIKGLTLLGLIVYLAFALIVIRQVALMAKTLNGNFSLSLKLVAWGHLLAAGLIFLLALIIL